MGDRLILESEVIDALMRVVPFRMHHKGEIVLLLNKRECLNAIRGIPSATAKQKKGRWIHIEPEPTPDEMRGWMPWYCSECGVGVGKHQTAFCPNCGADMRGGE